MSDDNKTTQRVAIIGAGMSMASALLSSLAARGIPAEVLAEFAIPPMRSDWPEIGLGKPKQVNTGRRAEKDARALEKAEAKRARKAAKRLRDATGGAQP